MFAFHGQPCGCGSKLNRRGYYSGFGPCFHLPGFHFGTGFLSHGHVFSCGALCWLDPVHPDKDDICRDLLWHRVLHIALQWLSGIFSTSMCDSTTLVLNLQLLHIHPKSRRSGYSKPFAPIPRWLRSSDILDRLEYGAVVQAEAAGLVLAWKMRHGVMSAPSPLPGQNKGLQ